ncbi:phage tail sheath subtilisin-like domain-containing protein [Brevundimonas sp.]|uniref:phage tail sheath subtilisin-like domain-containing protein n=1 Tax=Brevundimonas sp. TaxID=1871086 RepID=UPI003F708AB3
MIDFNQIPLDLRTPGTFIEFDASRATSGAGLQPQRILVIGQKTNAGTAATGVAVRITSTDQAIAEFGRGSMLARMFATFLKANPTAEVSGLALADNGAGVAAAKTITVTGTATKSGALPVWIGGQRVQVAITIGDVAADVGTKIAAALQAAPDLPVSAQANTAGVVTLTDRHKGELGNATDIRFAYRTEDVVPAGLTLVVASSVAGAANPDVAAAFAAIGDSWFNHFVIPWTDAANLAVVEAELADRWGPLRMIEGLAHTAAAGSFATLTTLGSGRNSPHVTIGGLKGSPTRPEVIAAASAGVISYYGAIDPARPFQTLILPDVLAPAAADRFSRQERDLLLRDGISTFTVAADGSVMLERPITTYQTNGFGLPDGAYLDVNTPLTLGYLRWSARARISTKYGRHKLGDDGVPYGPGQAVVTPKTIRAELVSLYGDWITLGLVEDMEAFKADLIVERDPNDPNRLNALIPPRLINQLRVFAGKVQFRL